MTERLVVESVEELVKGLRDHASWPTLARGVERCVCGESTVGQPGWHREHVTQALIDSGAVQLASDMAAKALRDAAKRKCPKCGHDAEMHWFTDCPPDENGVTTACRDCRPRQMYPQTFEGGRLRHEGMCTWTRDDIDRAAALGGGS